MYAKNVCRCFIDNVELYNRYSCSPKFQILNINFSYLIPNISFKDSYESFVDQENISLFIVFFTAVNILFDNARVSIDMLIKLQVDRILG